MTVQEAQEAIEYLEKMDGSCSAGDPIYCAIEALEKQVPKKPTMDEYEFLHCPVCNTPLDNMRGYCSMCGQGINWLEFKGNEDENIESD